MTSAKLKRLAEIGNDLAEMVLAGAKAGTIAPHDALAAVTAWSHLTLRSMGTKPNPKQDV